MTTAHSAPPAAPGMTRRAVLVVFAGFAFAYFFSALVRAAVATLAPALSAEFALSASDLGLLAGAYFIGFASLQLPMGSALDRLGARLVLLTLLSLAVLGCALFALAEGFAALTAARALIGMGVSACLMAPLTFYRRHLSAQAQLRAASWMLMTGSLGMLASTLPVQWLLPLIGWRAIFWLVAAGLCMAMLAIAVLVPAAPAAQPEVHADGGYAQVFAHRGFLRLMPMGFFHYGGLVALQALWIGPWLSKVCGWTPGEAAQGLFALNLAMLVAFLAWGSLVPRLYARGWTAQTLIARWAPLSLAVLVAAIALGPRASAAVWTVFCVSSTVVTLAQPAVGQAFPPALAGRALSAYNLVVFLGIFAIQWAIGGAIDGLLALGLGMQAAYQGAFAGLALACIGSYAWFLGFDDRTGRSADNAAR